MKQQMFENFAKGLSSDNFATGEEMYYAMYAYEIYGDGTRDNTFDELVEIGRGLEESGGEE